MRRMSRAHSAVASRTTALLVAVGLVAVLALAFVSDSYYVYEITVQGNSLVSAEEILEQTQLEGYSIFFIDPRQAEERIELLPDVREAKVELSLPNRMVVLVQERKARAVWQTGEQRHGVDEDGLIVSLRGQAEPAIVITDLDSTALRPGDRLETQAIAAAEEYQRLLSGVSNFEYSAQNGLSYRNGDGWQVCLGDGNSAALKVAIVDALVQQLTAQGATVESIDVRFPESPLYRVAEGPAPGS